MPGPRHPILRAALALAVAATAAGCGAGSDAAERPASPAPPARRAAPKHEPAARAATSAAADAPLEQVVGDLLMTKLDGPVASAQELAAVRSLAFGGVILFGPNVHDAAGVRALTTSLDAARAPGARHAGLPAAMLVSVDQEGGAIRNVPFAPPDVTQPQLGAAGSVDAARTAATATGRALRDIGVTMDLGPVADLAVGPNRTMAGRAFGDDAATVAPFVAASVEGLQAGGVAAAVKHFPGFGASTANSDEAVAYVDRTAAELRERELVPFRAAVRAGTQVVMVSHGVHRELGSRLPGTLDPRVATTLLRDELGFRGVAMTDSMNARGLREAWGDTVPRACPVAIGAGIDLLLLTGTLETARLCRARILDAVREGTLSEERVREAVARVSVLRRQAASTAALPPR
ncbi:MAG: glycoside hydrolase family 3 protein [Thermoleophilia bacterium]|nr:glycoside hydrolase family 3 protein [Thermoleophilia bacterium]